MHFRTDIAGYKEFVMSPRGGSFPTRSPGGIVASISLDSADTKGSDENLSPVVQPPKLTYKTVYNVVRYARVAPC